MSIDSQQENHNKHAAAGVAEKWQARTRWWSHHCCWPADHLWSPWPHELMTRSSHVAVRGPSALMLPHHPSSIPEREKAHTLFIDGLPAPLASQLLTIPSSSPELCCPNFVLIPRDGPWRTGSEDKEDRKHYLLLLSLRTTRSSGTQVPSDFLLCQT